MLQSVLWLSAHVRAVCETRATARTSQSEFRSADRDPGNALDAFHYTLAILTIRPFCCRKLQYPCIFPSPL
jgi:hypothetical protein